MKKLSNPDIAYINLTILYLLALWLGGFLFLNIHKKNAPDRSKGVSEKNCRFFIVRVNGNLWKIRAVKKNKFFFPIFHWLFFSILFILFHLLPPGIIITK